MAEAIVPHLLSLVSIVQSQYAHSSKYKQYLNDLKVLIEEINRILENANSMEIIGDSNKIFMKQARKFLYDSQDVIDDLMQHEGNGMLEGLLPCLYKLFNRGRFAYQAEDISQRLNAIATIKRTITDLAPEFQAPQAPSISAHHSSSTAFPRENDDDLKGIDRAREQLVGWLINDDLMSKVIFVHGAQGVGKTSLVATVFRNAEVKRRFRSCVWVEPIHHNRLMESNVEMWDLTTEDKRKVTLGVAFQRMSDPELSNDRKRWALILDDAREAHVIESLLGHLDPTRPSVLITTRDSSLESSAKELASASRTSTGTPGVPAGGAPSNWYFSLMAKFHFRIPARMPRASLNSQQAQSNGDAPNSLNGFRNFKHVSLSQDDSFELLCWKIFNNDPRPDKLEEDCKSILETCEGLPLAILATGALLKQNLGDDNGTPQSVIWGDLSGRLGEELLSKWKTSDLIRRMITLRMDQLHNIHACLFYLSIFPLGYPIRCSTLMRLWVAERFAIKEGRRTDQAIAEEKLRKLLDHNFIWKVEKTSYGRVRTCRIHNLQHEIIMKKSKDHEFAVVVADQKEEWAEWPEAIWRLSLHGKMGPKWDGEIFRSEIDSIRDRFKQLRSLLVFKEVYLDSMEELLRHTDRLNVLHLEASSLKSFPKRICSLKYLRYLKLRNTDVETIPEDIRYLVHLETLDLKGTRVRKLPDGILELKKLHHLLVYTSKRSPHAAVDPKLGVRVPSALGDLNSLQKLCMIELNPVKARKSWGKHWKREQLLGELGKLTSLLRLGISMLISKDGGLLCSSIEKLTKLEALYLIAAPNETIDLSEMKNTRKAPTRLQRVHLIGCFGELPYWLLSSKSLVKLFLKRSQLNGDPLQHLGKLQSLKHLELQQAFDVQEMTFEAGWFPQLRFLGLHGINGLHTIIVQKEALLTLEVLSLAQCPSLTEVPRHITRPRKLSCLELLDMPGAFVRSVQENAAVSAKMMVKVERWINEAVEPVMTLPDHPEGSPSDPRGLNK